MPTSLIHKFREDSLFRNSIYLMAATAVLSLFGFFFWLINARLFSADDVGFATTLISVMNLIALISLIGFNAALVRFLPKNEKPSDIINTGLILVSAAALILSGIFLIALPSLSPKLLFLRESVTLSFAFMLFSVLAAVNTLTDSVFLANRQSKYIFLINGIFSGARIFFPFFFIGFGAAGIFVAAGIAQGIGFLISIAMMMWKFGYRPAPIVRAQTVRDVWRYSASNYAASSLNLLPASVLPLIITESMGPASAAYYYMAMMIGNLLYVIPYATTRSLFAEGSHDENAIAGHVRGAISIIARLMTPGIIVLVVGSGFILNFFGAQYAAGGQTLLILIALAGIVVSATSLLNSYFQVKKDTAALIVMNAVYAAATLLCAFLFLSRGLPGIGVAWILGNLIASAAGFLLVRYPLQLSQRYQDISYELWVRYTRWKRFRRARARGARGTVLFYPDLPKYYYVHYTICHQLGLAMTNNPRAPFDVAMSFKDATTREEDAVEKDLKSRGRFINGEARDISKEKVEEVFADVFGYGMKIDPATHHGECVQKSNENATHDGKVVMCPREPEAGYIYQKLVNNRAGDRVSDLRVKVVGGKIPFVMYRTRSAFDRFDNTQTATMVPINENLSKDEQEKILLFCKKMGIDFGALDCLRDADDGRLYIVDANLTTGTPMPGFHCSQDEFEVYVAKFSAAFKDAFLKS